MGRKYDYDYMIIGSGPAGTAAAIGLAKSRKRIAIVDGGHFGGARLNTRNVPYGVALDFAHSYANISMYPEFGHQDLSFSFPTMISRQLQATVRAGGDSKQAYEAAGVTCIDGYANFLDSHTVAIGEHQYTAANFILATGAQLKASEISGLDTVNYLTPDTAIKTRRLPKAVFVVGAGATGCEIAEYFAELGTKVLIAEMAERILPREDKEVGTVLSEYLSTELDVTVLPNCKVVALEQDNLSKSVIFQTGRSEKMVRVDCVVLATGSRPVLDCGLENAGVKYQNTGIKVNKYFETSAKNIYAIGDCISVEASSERAELEGAMLASNIVNKTKNTVNYSGFARVIDTYPQIATVGLNEDDLLRRDRKYHKALIPLADTMAGKIYNMDYGFVKLLTDKRNYRIIGASVVAPNAALIAEELAIAVRHNLTAAEIASTPHLADGYNYAVRMAAKAIITKKK